MARDTFESDSTGTSMGQWDGYAPGEVPKIPGPPQPYSGGTIMQGWAAAGNTWVPIYRGDDGNLYTAAKLPWSGDGASLRTGNGEAGKPTWKPGESEPTTAKQTYQESVVAANTPKPSAPPPVSSSSSTSKPKPPAAAPTPKPAAGPALDPRTMGGLLEPYVPNYPQPNFDADAQAAVDRMAKLDPLTLPDFKWTPPTADSIYNDPSYKLRKGEGERALMNSKVSQGLGRTAGTLQSLMNYNSEFAGTEYGNIWNRDLNSANLQWGNNVDKLKAEYEPKVLEYATKNNVIGGAVKDAQQAAWDKVLNDWKVWDANQTNLFNRLKWKTEFDRDSAAA